MKKILYIGDSNNYVDNLAIKLADFSDDVYFERVSNTNDEDEIARICFDRDIDILIMGSIFKKFDLEGFSRRIRGVAKRIGSIVALIVEEEKPFNLAKFSNIGDILYFYKGIDDLNVYNYIISFLFPERIQKNELLKALYTDKFNLYQSVMLRYLKRDYARIETNHVFRGDEAQPISFPFGEKIFKSDKHIIESFLTEGKSYYYNFVYKLEYCYLTRPIKSQNLKSIEMEYSHINSEGVLNREIYSHWVESEKAAKSLVLVDEPDDTEEDEGEIEGEEYVRVPKKIELGAKASFANLLYENSDAGTDKEISLLVFSRNIDDFPGFKKLNYQTFFRTNIDFYKKDIADNYPDIIVLDYKVIKDLAWLKSMVTESVKYKNYFPYVILFNYSGMDMLSLQDSMEYHFIIINPGPINIDFTSKVIEILKKKKTEARDKKAKKRLKDVQKRLGPIETLEAKHLYDQIKVITLEDDEALFDVPMEVTLISISEVDILFKSEIPLNEGQVFKINNPVDMQIVIVGHIPESAESKVENAYRGIIHYIKEDDLQALRRYLNEVSVLLNEGGKGVKYNDIIALKAEYFQKT